MLTNEEILYRNKLLYEIAEKISKKQLSLYIGAGVSVPSHIPSWNDIVKECCKELKIKLTDYEDNYYKLLEIYALKFGRNALANKFKGYINNATNNDNHILEELSKLNFNKIWTTNFDDILQKYLNQNATTCNIINTDEKFAEILLYDGISIIKLNGDFNTHTQIITEQDYLNYEKNFKNIYLNFQSELYIHSFLIVGSSLSDGLYLPTIYKLFPNSVPPHKSYCLMKKQEGNKNQVQRFKLNMQYLKHIYNIETILYDEHTEIPEILKCILKLSINRTCFISGSLPQRRREEQEELENTARIFCRELSNCLMDIEIKINTCFGMLIGNYISFPITTTCVKKGVSVNKYLQIYPLDNKLSSKDATEFRNKIISKGKYFIAMGGSPTQKSGVYSEFLLAKELGKIIIPIPLLGGCGELIFNEIINSTTFQADFPYLFNYVAALSSKTEYIVAEAVKDIILSTMHNQYS